MDVDISSYEDTAWFYHRVESEEGWDGKWMLFYRKEDVEDAWEMAKEKFMELHQAGIPAKKCSKPSYTNPRASSQATKPQDPQLTTSMPFQCSLFGLRLPTQMRRTPRRSFIDQCFTRLSLSGKTGYPDCRLSDSTSVLTMSWRSGGRAKELLMAGSLGQQCVAVDCQTMASVNKNKALSRHRMKFYLDIQVSQCEHDEMINLTKNIYEKMESVEDTRIGLYGFRKKKPTVYFDL